MVLTIIFGNDKPRTKRFTVLMPVGSRELTLAAALFGSLGRNVNHGGTEFSGEIDEVGQRLGLGHVAAFRSVGPELYFRCGTSRAGKNQRSRHGHRRQHSNQLKLHLQKERRRDLPGRLSRQFNVFHTKVEEYRFNQSIFITVEIATGFLPQHSNYID